MPTNIESFVKTLEAEGVDAGRKAARKIETEAREKADKIVAEASDKAEKIVADAQAEGEKVKARMNSSLELAARDAIYMLREKLSEQLKIVLKMNVEKSLGNEETLARILREVIPVYAKADVENKLTAEINISEGLKRELMEAAIGDLANSLRNQNAQANVAYNLGKAGFECRIEGSTVEVSTESVTALLAEMIDPDLQRFLEKAADAGN